MNKRIEKMEVGDLKKLDPSRLAISHYCAQSASLSELAEISRRIGIAGLAITEKNTLKSNNTTEIAKILNNSPVRCSSVNSAGYFAMHKDNHALSKVASELNAPLNIIDGGLLPGVPIELPLNLRSKLPSYLKALVSMVQGAGTILSLEPIHPSGVIGKGLVNTLAQLDTILDEIPELGVTLDLYHSWWDPDLLAFIDKRVERLRVVQVCGLKIGPDRTVERSPDPEDGKSHILTFVGALEAAGYDGLYEIEYFLDDTADEAANWVTRWVKD